MIVKATKNSEAGLMPSEKLLAELGNFNEQLVKAGVMLAGDGLHPSSKGKRVRISGEKRRVIDGPFTETKELIAGYWRCPAPMPGEDSEIEIRPVFEADDFGQELTPELRAQEERLAAEVNSELLQARATPTRCETRWCGCARRPTGGQSGHADACGKERPSPRH